MTTTTTRQVSSTAESDPLVAARALEIAQAYDGAESIEAALALVADDAEFVIGGGTYTGKDEIREWMEHNLEVKVEASDFSADGNTVEWRVVIEVLDSRLTQTVTAVVEDDRIQSLRSR